MKRSVKSSDGGRTENEASRAYRELEQTFPEKNRLAGEPNRKPVSTTQNQLHKTTCRNCAVHVEYPSEAEGQITPCPRCGNNLTLSVWCVDGISGEEVDPSVENAPPPETNQMETYEDSSDHKSAQPAYVNLPGHAPFNARTDEATRRQRALHVGKWRGPESEQRTRNINEPVYSKVSCGSCEGHIEYAASSAGETLACPYCNKPVFLPHVILAYNLSASERSKSSDEKWWKSGLVWYAIFLIFGFLCTAGFIASGAQVSFFKGCLWSLAVLVGIGVIIVIIALLIENMKQSATKAKIQQPTTSATKSKSSDICYEICNWLGVVGLAGIIACVYYFLIYSTASPEDASVVNLERLNTRQGGIIIGAVAAILGCGGWAFFAVIGGLAEQGEKKDGSN
jgi:hypothetical protein